MPKRIVDLSTVSTLESDDLLLIADSSDAYLSKKAALSQFGPFFSLVTSVFGRTGDIVAALGDYTSSQVTNSSTVAGATVTDALNALNNGQASTTVLTAGIAWVSPIDGIVQVTLVGGGGGGGGAGGSDASSNGGGGNPGEMLSGYVAVSAGVTVSYSLGSAGPGGVGANSGTNGGNTVFSSFQANGGQGGSSGVGGDAGSAAGVERLKNSFVPSSLLQVIAYQPSQGATSGYYDGVSGGGGQGGNSIYGTGGAALTSAGNGNAATGYGAGGGGAFNGSTSKTGGVGTAGVVVVKY